MRSFCLPFTFLLLLSLPLTAADTVALLNCESLSIAAQPSAATNDPNISWTFNPGVGTQKEDDRGAGNKKCLLLSRNTPYNLTAMCGATTIPYVRSLSFMAKACFDVADYPLSACEVKYQLDGEGVWSSTGVSCSPALSTISTTWQTFTVTLPRDYMTAKLRISIHAGDNTILLDDLMITYDPNYSPAPDPCSNCFQITIP